MKIDMPQTVNEIINALNNSDKKAYVVGGCVRDYLLNIVPKDWDIATEATPEEIINIFKGYEIIPTGLKHGTVTLVDENKENYEITTFRIDGDYSDSRKPDSVEFTSSLAMDLSRRDFTINAMAYNNAEGLIDLYGGQNDLKNKVIKCVGNAKERFNEDALRILRAYRFKSRFNSFTIDRKTEEAIILFAHLLPKISKERVQSELNQILLNDARVLIDMKNTKALDYIMPKIVPTYTCTQNNPNHMYDVFMHSVVATFFTSNTLHIKLAALLHDIGKPFTKHTDENNIDHFYSHPAVSSTMAFEILKELKYDNKTIEKVIVLIEEHDNPLGSKRSVKRMLSRIGEDSFNDLISLKHSDINAQSFYNACDKKLELSKAVRIKNQIIEENECFNLKHLNVNGRDILSLGVKPGPEIGRILGHLLNEVLDESIPNEYDELIEKAKRFINV